MKSGTLWIIRVALTVQFLCVLSVPTLVAAAESPRALWLSEWIRPHAIERTIGVLRLRDSKLTFTEQIGQVDWQLDLSAVKRIATVNGGRSLLIVSITGDEYVVSILGSRLERASPKHAASTIESAIATATGGH
jgi:hypothetical protein